MGRRVEIPIQGKSVAGHDVDFSPQHESWNEYRLEDGSIVKVRVVVTNIILTEQKNDAGDPVVAVKSKTLVSYHPREEGNDG